MNITIFGYGNDSRMDDGVAFSLAPGIAEYLEGRGHRVTLSLEHQLLPEAAAELEEAEFAVFVDASMETTPEGFQVRSVQAREILEGLNLHTVGPDWSWPWACESTGVFPKPGSSRWKGSSSISGMN